MWMLSHCRMPTTWQNCRCPSKPAQPIPSTRREKNQHNQRVSFVLRPQAHRSRAEHPWPPEPLSAAETLVSTCQALSEMPTVTPRLRPRTRCGCSAPREGARPPAASAPWAPLRRRKGLGMMTSKSGDQSLRNWVNCTHKEMQKTCRSPSLVCSKFWKQGWRTVLHAPAI